MTLFIFGGTSIYFKQFLNLKNNSFIFKFYSTLHSYNQPQLRETFLIFFLNTTIYTNLFIILYY